MTLFCVTCDQIDKWMKDFNENNSPEDLVNVNDPKLFLSCRLGGSTANKAYACYGDELAEEILIAAKTSTALLKKIVITP